MMQPDQIPFWASLTTLDYLVLGVLFFSSLISLLRGFIREMISLFTWVFAIWLVLHFSDFFVVYLTQYVHSKSLSLMISSAAVVLFALLLGMIFTQLVMMLVRFTGLSGLDRFAGFFFGLLRGLLIVVLGLVLAKSTHFDDSPTWKASVMVKTLEPAIVWAESWLPNHIDDITDKFYHPKSSIKMDEQNKTSNLSDEVKDLSLS